MSKTGHWREVKLRNSKILPWGLDINVTQCSMEDINWVLSGTVRNHMIKMVAKAIEAAEWFKEVWCVEENGTLLRPFEHVSRGEDIEFKQVSLNPIDPQTNIWALSVFRRIQIHDAFLDEELSNIVSLDSSQRIMADKDGFYILEVRQEYN